MKKLKFRIINIVIAALSVAAIAVSSANAAAFVSDGFEYTIINNYSVAISGYEDQAKNVVIPERLDNRLVTSINYNSFRDNKEITALDFSQAKYLEVIGYSAFYGCSSVSNQIVIPESVKRIDSYAFSLCESIPMVQICNNIKVIQPNTFAGCTSLYNVILPQYLQKIQDAAFANCSALEYIEIPKSVSEISWSAFYNTPVTLGVWYGTTGYDYAIAQSIPYILLDNNKLGDTDGDGYVNINDVTHIQRHLAELESLEGIYFHVADANQDGTLDISDATTLQMYLAEYDIPYPIGEVITQ